MSARPGGQLSWKFAAVTMAVSVGALVISLAVSAAADEIAVMADRTPVQSGTTVLTYVRSGDRFQVLRRQGEWIQVTVTASGAQQQGWINRKFVQEVVIPQRVLDVLAKQSVRDQCLVCHELNEELQAEGKYVEALAYLEHSAKMAPQAFARDRTYPSILHNLGVLYVRLAQYKKAKPCYVEAQRLYQELTGGLNPATEMSLGLLHRHLGELAQAEEHLQRSLELYTASKGPDSPNVAQSLNNLGLLYTDLNELTKSEEMYLRCLKIREVQLGEHPLVASTLNNLAIVYHAQLAAAKAERLYLRALKIQQQHLGEDNVETSNTMNNLAYFYVEFGQYEKAEPLFRKAIEVKRSRLGADHPAVAETMSNLGLMFNSMQRYEDAEHYLVESLKIVERRLGADHIDLAGHCNNLANLYGDMGKFEQAEKLHRRALELRRKWQGETHPKFALALNNLANVYRSTGRTEQALELDRQSLAIRELVLGDAHPDTAQSLHNIALTKARLQQWESAAEHFDRSRRVIRRHVRDVLPGLSEKQQIGYLRTQDERFLHLALSLGYQRREDAHVAALSADWLLNSKGVTQETLAQQSLLSREAGSPEQQAVAIQLLDVRRLLASATYEVPATAGEVAARKDKLANLQAREQQLSSQLADFLGRSAGDQPWMEIAQLRKRLPPDSVFVQILRLKLTSYGDSQDKSDRYLAWLIYPEADSTVQVVDLGAADEVEALAATAREAIHAGAGLVGEQGEPEAERVLKQALEGLAKQVLHPLLPQIADRKRWLISPDAALWLIPWSALPLEGGKYAIEDHSIRYLISGRELLAEKQVASNVASEAPLLLADPDFDLKSSDRNADTRGTGLRQVAPRTRSLLPQVGRLPGTALEARMVAPLLERFCGTQPTVLQGEQALETRFRQARHPRAAVLCTHGYFFADQHLGGSDRSLESAEGQVPILSEQGELLENPLLRCGLLLAGCNERSLNEGTDDGVLTGLEIVGVDLRGTELVVLSACETGIGEVQNGSGVAGLRQAFQLAGAQGVVATLWQIPDLETVKLMAAFFSGLADNQAKADALREAQLEQIAARRKRFGAAHPYFWAAFTFTGQDR